MPQAIRAKLVVSSVVKNGESESVELFAVCDGSEENRSFSRWTPCATVRMTIDNPSAQGFFVQSDEYYLDFTKAPPKSAQVAASAGEQIPASDKNPCCNGPTE